MSNPDLLKLLAIILLGAASVFAITRKSWVAALVCAAGVCLLLAGHPLLHF
ncbi:hypothetical protein [Sphaerisporangium aureirubrum]|uniref:Uncharacterized protein n=1 Tax=Sphaerisporangium aureirubrum TaxID=1544736 RepID=A0ABW1NC50_9ACTN